MARAAAAAASAALVIASGASAAQPAAPARYAPGPAAPSLAGLVRAMGAAGAAQARFAYLRKLDSHLQDLEAARLAGRDLAATARRGALTLADAGDVLVDVYVRGDLDAATAALRARGMKIHAVSDRQPQRMVEGALAVSALTDVAGLASTKAVLAVQGSATNEGTVLSQGDGAHRGPQARALGTTGSGVTVGIISNSIGRVGGGVADSQASGNLPGPASSPPGQVQVLLDGAPGNSDEGRAMAEIVYDTAPGVRNMLFTTGTNGSAVRATGIDNLVAGGAKVIADDTVQLTAPFFQDGAVAQAVDRAKAAGVTYLVSAGNRARQSWEGTYAAMADPRGISPSTTDFDPGAGTDAIQTIGTFSNFQLFLSLQWDEPFGQASTDLAIDWYEITGGVPAYLFTTDSDNIATGIPSEFETVSSGGSATIAIAIRRKAGARDPFMKYVAGGVGAFTIAEHDTSSGAIDPDASSARGALAVAASSFATPATPQPYSSRGPAFKRFDAAGNRLAAPENRNKPDLTAADGVATSVPGFATFGGTSAAAPSAAGVAALALSARPSLTVEQVAAILKDGLRSIDCTLTIGLPDPDCGFGFPLADAAVRAAQDTTPPVVTPALSPASPDGADGWYTSPVGVSFGTADPESPILSTTGCAPSSATTDTTGESFGCAATSIGGSASQPVTIKRDASPPATPAFAGIAAQSYAVAQLPAAAAISCSAGDPTSGVTGCAVGGYSAALGAHTLTATATNGAGLTSTATLIYTVLPAPPAPARAISALSASKKRLPVATIVRFGLKGTVKAAATNTKLTITVTLRGRRVASQSRTVGKGTKRLAIRLHRTGRGRLRARPGDLTITVKGSAAGLRATTLTAKVKTRR